MPRTVIKGGVIVTPGQTFRGDVEIEGERIAALSINSSVGPDDSLINADGLLVLPGLVDAHTHIKLDTGIFQTADNWEIGSKAAAAGGVTTVVDFANQIRGKSFDAALKARIAEASPSIIDYAFHMVVLEPAAEVAEVEAQLQEILSLGLASIKLFTTYRPNYYLDDAKLWRILSALPDNMTAMVHCENDSLVTDATNQLVANNNTGWRYHAQGRPPAAEIEAIARVCNLAHLANCKGSLYIAHCSTADSVLEVERWRGAGSAICCETCPQYLLLNESAYEGDRPEQFILQPPLREASHLRRLRELAVGGAIDVLSTDTCDYSLEQKRANPDFMQTPGGLPGIETLLPLMYTLFCVQLGEPLDEIIHLITENPARIFGLYPRKGALMVGSDADVVLYDPEPGYAITHQALHYRAGYSPYEGMQVKGRVQMTLSRGEIIYQDGDFPSRIGRGQFVSVSP